MVVIKIATRSPAITVFSSGVMRMENNLATLHSQAIIQLPNGNISQW